MMAFRKKCTIVILALCVACSTGDDEVTMDPVITDTEIVRIPVVVHVLYNREEFNISVEKIQSQIRVLNEDYRRTNSDWSKTPQEFLPLVTDMGIEFFLADVDPDGNPSDGITRTVSDLQGFDGKPFEPGVPIEDRLLFFSEKAGYDAWPSDTYLNIWVVEMSDRHGNIGLPGYAQFPGGDVRTDGVVIDPRVFGTLPPLVTGHALGRTATHEIGHWLNLFHVFGNADGCESSDLVDDTPPAATRYLGNPSYPQYSCGHSNLFMNFMDYVNDDAMYMFSHGQRERVRSTFKPGGGRFALYKNLREKTSPWN